jgi:hypothetical protein
VLASLEMCWHSLKEQLKSVCKLRNVSAFVEGAVQKRVGKLRHVLALFHKEQLNKCWQA